ncbi:MAG: oxidoreductase, partial [Candidatus Kapaibacterium sp.]
MKKTAVIAGASGLIGTALLPLLLQSDEVEAVHSLGRRMLDVRHEKLTQHIVDFGDLSSLDLPCHHVYCCVGTTIR